VDNYHKQNSTSTRIAGAQPQLLQETFLFADESATSSVCAKKEVRGWISVNLGLADFVEADLYMLTAAKELPEVCVFVAGLGR